MKAIGYVRVSTGEQAQSGAGLTAQRDTIVREAEARGWELVHVYEDAGVGGSTLNRDGLSDAVAAMESGQAEGLVVAKLDRLSRSLVDFAALMERSRKKGWAVVALDVGVDTTTPSGEMVANVMATFAQFERRLIGQRTKEALAVKRAEGVRLGRPRALSDAVVDEIVRRRHVGESLRAIADDFNQRGVPTAQGGARWWPATIRKVERGSFVAG